MLALVAVRSTAALVLLAQLACGGDKSVDPIDDPAVPTTITANSSTSLTGVAGAVVSPSPSVVVKDQNGAPIAGVTVTFDVTGGGGVVLGSSVATDASGVATVGSWTLGATAGPNTLTASTGTLTPVTFTATGTAVTVNPCTVRASHTPGTTSTGSLATTDCLLDDGSFLDFFSMTLGEANAYLFRESAAFDSYLFLATSDGAVIAENDDESLTSKNSTIKALLPAGSYLLGASSLFPGITGSYSITSSTTSTAVTGCQLVFVTRNVSTSQSVEASDCLRTPPPAAPIYGDQYFIFIRAGQSITATMTSIQVDAYLEILDGDGNRVASNDNRDATTKDSELSFTAAVTNYYRLFAQAAVNSQTGNYSLTIQ